MEDNKRMKLGMKKRVVWNYREQYTSAGQKDAVE